jgi:hypothetical protein
MELTNKKVEIEERDATFTIGIYANSRGFAAVLLKKTIKLTPRGDEKRRTVMRRTELIEVPQLKPIKYSHYPHKNFGFGEIGRSIEGLVGECTSMPHAHANDLPVLRDFIENMGFNMIVSYTEVDPENLLLTINAMTKDRTLIYPNRQTENGAITTEVIAETKRMKEAGAEESHLLNAIGLSLQGHQFGNHLWLEALENLGELEWDK